jgi:hypothetical protein
VLDARGELALETSFANAGRFCPSSLALGSPAQGAGLRRAFIPNWLLDTTLFRQADVDSEQPLTAHMRVDFTRPRLLYWGLCSLFLSNPDKGRLVQAHQLMARHTVKATAATISKLRPDDVRSLAIHPGTLYMYHGEAGMAGGAAKAQHVQEDTDFSATILSAEEAVLRFPWLRDWKKQGDAVAPHRFPGAVYVGQDWSADARKFVEAVARLAQQDGAAGGSGRSSGRSTVAGTSATSGVSFQLRTRVQRVVAAGVEVVKADGTIEIVPADVVVLACGVKTSALVPNGARRLPMEGLRGVSVDLYGCNSNSGAGGGGGGGGSSGTSSQGALDEQTRSTGLPNVAVADFGSGDLNFQITPYVRHCMHVHV